MTEIVDHLKDIYDSLQETADSVILRLYLDGRFWVDHDKGKVYSNFTKREMGNVWKRDRYRRIHLRDGKDRRIVMAHRVVYITRYGEIPDGYVIDHINRKRDDNRIVNLRAVPVIINLKNRRYIHVRKKDTSK
jgi:hypothetical protein